MGLTNLYYLNGADLASSTSVFFDVYLTNLAPDGWYSQDGIVREQVGGILQAAAPCESCAPPCGIEWLADDSTNEYIEYVSTINTTPALGCVRIDIDTTLSTNTVFGFRCFYGPNIYNYAVGQLNGYVQAPASDITYLSDGVCTSPAYPCGFVYKQKKLDFFYSYYYTGNTVAGCLTTSNVITVPSTTIDRYTMFIPKTIVGEDDVSLYLYALNFGGACQLNARVSVLCPILLPKISVYTGQTFVDGAAACAFTPTSWSSAYIGYINGSFGSISVGDILFMDSSSATPWYFLPGWYLFTNGPDIIAFETDANGVIINIQNC